MLEDQRKVLKTINDVIIETDDKKIVPWNSTWLGDILNIRKDDEEVLMVTVNGKEFILYYKDGLFTLYESPPCESRFARRIYGNLSGGQEALRDRIHQEVIKEKIAKLRSVENRLPNLSDLKILTLQEAGDLKGIYFPATSFDCPILKIKENLWCFSRKNTRFFIIYNSDTTAVASEDEAIECIERCIREIDMLKLKETTLSDAAPSVVDRFHNLLTKKIVGMHNSHLPSDIDFICKFRDTFLTFQDLFAKVNKQYLVYFSTSDDLFRITFRSIKDQHLLERSFTVDVNDFERFFSEYIWKSKILFTFNPFLTRLQISEEIDLIKELS